MKKSHDIKLLNGGKTKIIVDDKQYVYVPITIKWFLDNNVGTDEFHTILKAMDIDSEDYYGKNTRKKLRDIIMEMQK